MGLLSDSGYVPGKSISATKPCLFNFKGSYVRQEVTAEAKEANDHTLLKATLDLTLWKLFTQDL